MKQTRISICHLLPPTRISPGAICKIQSGQLAWTSLNYWQWISTPSWLGECSSTSVSIDQSQQCTAVCIDQSVYAVCQLTNRINALLSSQIDSLDQWRLESYVKIFKRVEYLKDVLQEYWVSEKWLFLIHVDCNTRLTDDFHPPRQQTISVFTTYTIL